MIVAKKTKELLSKAINLVGGDRQRDYGDKVKNHDNIAKLWSAYLDVKVLKMARTKLGAVSEDTYIDMAAYSAIAGEIKFEEKNGKLHIK
jgi:hypothetical protein